MFIQTGIKMLNTELVRQLAIFANYYDIIGDIYRAKSYHNAAAVVKSMSVEITAESLPLLLKKRGIGTSIGAKLRGFVANGYLEGINDITNGDILASWNTLQSILGTGPAAASMMISRGIRSIDDVCRGVKEGKLTLTRTQTIGVKYHADLSLRIPRDEVTAVERFIRAICLSIDKSSTAEALGSYRRGGLTSGDIDILICSRKSILREVFSGIKNRMEIISMGESRHQLLINWEGRWRQLDLLWAPPSEYYAALLYFTGSATHARDLRNECKKQGYRLNQHGLFKILSNGSMRRVVLKSERHVYDILGIYYVEPTMRT